MIDDSTNPPTAAFNTEAGLTVLKYWDQLLNQDKVYQLGFEDGFGGDGFKAGKVAITFNGPWTLESYKEAGLNFGVIGQPQGYNGEKSAMMGGFGLVIPNGAKNPDASWEFINGGQCSLKTVWNSANQRKPSCQQRSCKGSLFHG